MKYDIWDLSQVNMGAESRQIEMKQDQPRGD